MIFCLVESHSVTYCWITKYSKTLWAKLIAIILYLLTISLGQRDSVSLAQCLSHSCSQKTAESWRAAGRSSQQAHFSQLYQVTFVYLSMWFLGCDLIWVSTQFGGLRRAGLLSWWLKVSWVRSPLGQSEVGILLFMAWPEKPHSIPPRPHSLRYSQARSLH